jgi:hypothetical protein
LVLVLRDDRCAAATPLGVGEGDVPAGAVVDPIRDGAKAERGAGGIGRGG